MIDLTILAAFGIILTIGIIGSDIFKKFRFPQILGFILVGVILNVIFGFFFSEYVDFVLGANLVCIGIAAFLGISYILPTMIFGIIISSLATKPEIDIPTKRLLEEVSEHVSPELVTIIYEKKKELLKKEPHLIFKEVYSLISPIIAIFFLLIGLSLDLSSISQIGLIGILYMITRTVAKAFGASLGAYTSKAEKVVQKYLGPCLLSQAGVALGLAVLISEHLAQYGAEAAEMGLFILNTITATTIIFQIFGPLAIQWAVDRSGESQIKGSID